VRRRYAKHFFGLDQRLIGNGAGSSFTDLSQSRPSKDLKKKFLVCLFWFEKIANCCEIILLGVFAHPHNEVRVCA
jgi:hypothetical protein